MVTAQTSELVSVARVFHDRLSQYYSQLAESTDNERMTLLLTHLSAQEAKLSLALGEYVRDAHHEVLEHWLHYPPDAQLPKFAGEALLADPHCTPDDVVLFAQRIEEGLARLFAQVAQCNPKPAVRELFESLVEMELMTEFQTASCTVVAD